MGNRWIKCSLAGLITFAAIIALELVRETLAADFTLAPVFVVVVAIAFTGGMYCSLTGSAIASFYTFYVLGISPRFFIVAASFFIVSFLTGYLKRRARIVDTLNGNINSVKQALAIVRFLRPEWQKATTQTVNANLEQLEDLLGNLASRILGWHKLREEMKEVEEFYQGGYKNT